MIALFLYLDQHTNSVGAIDQEALDFAEEALEALVNDGEVDYQEKIVIELEGKADCIYQKIRQQDIIKKVLDRFQVNSSPAKLKLEGISLGNSFGNTLSPDSNDLITIQINTDNTVWGVNYQPNVLVAQTLFHEIIHAEFYRQLVEAIGSGNYTGATYEEIFDALLTNKKYTLYEHIRKYKDWSHNFMANYYRETIARATQEFATGTLVPNNQQPSQLYLDLAWRGLRIDNEVDAWDALTESQQTAIDEVITNYSFTNSNQNCTE